MSGKAQRKKKVKVSFFFFFVGETTNPFGFLLYNFVHFQSLILCCLAVVLKCMGFCVRERERVRERDSNRKKGKFLSSKQSKRPNVQHGIHNIQLQLQQQKSAKFSCIFFFFFFFCWSEILSFLWNLLPLLLVIFHLFWEKKLFYSYAIIIAVVVVVVVCQCILFMALNCCAIFQHTKKVEEKYQKKILSSS